MDNNLTTEVRATVRKEQMECYYIRANDEWATICLREWENRKDGMYAGGFGGEILIHSAFGSWANSWSACGCRFKKFLTQLDFSYAFGKFMGSKLSVFDGDKSLKELQRRVIEARKRTDMSKDDARDLWDTLVNYEDDITSGSDRWVYGLQEAHSDLITQRAKAFITEPWDFICHSPDGQAVGFWRDIWPTFMAEIKSELKPESVAA